MKVKTFAVIVTLLFLLALLVIICYAQEARLDRSSAQDVKPDSSSITTPAATEEPDNNYSEPTMPELSPNMTLPDVNESSINLTPVTLSESSNVIVKLAQTPTPTTGPYDIPATPTPTTDPRSAPMTPMKPMEPWKPASPMMP